MTKLEYLSIYSLVFLLATGRGWSAPAMPPDEQPWLSTSRLPEERAQLALAAMTLEEKISLLHGPMPRRSLPAPANPLPADVLPAAGYIPGIARLHLPALLETDASLGVTNPGGERSGDVATALPSSLALAATFSPDIAYRSGALIGTEAHAKGFNVLLNGGVNLTRDPRNGRNFEYLGEDPLLAGDLAGAAVRGIQAQHVISTVKHYALNANETNRLTLDARIDRAALRESDLLAFQIAIERGAPGAVMCAYNQVNGEYACANEWLLNGVLKGSWRYGGWVMSDWGAVHAETDLLHGLDQESGEQMDPQVWFGRPLAAAVAEKRVPMARIDDAVRRILRSEFAVGVVDHPPVRTSIDYGTNAQWALSVAQSGIVLLKNEPRLLPLPQGLARIAVIGAQANKGVPTGGGSSQVTPSNGPVTMARVGGRNAAYYPSVPTQVIHAATPGTAVVYSSGGSAAEAADMAASANIALIFVTRHESEGLDSPDMRLPDGQDALIEAVAAVNPRTIVILQTGNPVEMPWIDHVAGVLEAWFPGQEGAQAIADVLFGRVNPSGRLPMTFPKSEADVVRPSLPNAGARDRDAVSIAYTEGADVGYRWYARHEVTPLFAFGHGLSYSNFTYDHFKVEGGKFLSVSFQIANGGPLAGADVPQVYLTAAPAGAELKLVGYSRVELQPGERRLMRLTVDRRVIGHFDEARQRWRVAGGRYELRIARSATELLGAGSAALVETDFAD